MSNIKTYTNPERKTFVDTTDRTPQYQVHGIEPQIKPIVKVPTGTKIVPREPLPLDNPRGKRSVAQPAFNLPTPNNSQMLNVGNNMEHSWSGVDGNIVDDISDQIDQNQPMIDNNEIITDKALGYQNGFDAVNLNVNNMMKGKVSIESPINSLPQISSNDLLSIVNDLEDESFLLIVSGVPICSGPKEEIEDQAKALVFGEHQMCD